MGAWLDRLAGPLLDAGLAAGVWLGLVAMAMVASRQPARRSALARAGVVGALAMAPLCGSGAVPRLDVVDPIRRLGPPSWSSPEGPPSGPSPQIPPRARAWARRILTGGYLAGATAGLAWPLLGWWGARRLARRSTAPSRGTRELYETLTTATAPGRRPRLRVAPRVRRPGLLGLVRPWIAIPPELDRPAARDRLRLCLLHELAHAEGLDPWFGLAGTLAQALWFPWPQAWWVRAQMRLDHEFLADRRASVAFPSVGTYAASLVDLADPHASPGRGGSGAPGPPLGALGSTFFRRVLMLVRCPYPVELRPPLWWRIVLAPAAIAGVLVASSLTLRAVPIGPPASPDRGRFRLLRLSLPEPPSGHRRAPIPVQLPLSAPPSRFQLSLDVWADDADALAEIRVAGLPLTTAPRSPIPPAWHSVRILRDADAVSLWRDDFLVLDRVSPDSIGRTLTILPACLGPAEFRDLQLDWPAPASAFGPPPRRRGP